MNENEAIEYLQSRYLVVGSRVNAPKEECERHNEVVDMAIKALEEVQQYRAIGTVEDCRVAVEKQTAKKIEIFNGQASCTNCKHLFGGMDVIKKLITWGMPHCKNCGQKLDWSDEE